jgi:hypothetical protein
MPVRDQARLDTMRAMRAEGRPFEEVGKLFGISRQRASKLVGATGENTGWIDVTQNQIKEKRFLERFWTKYTVAPSGCWEWTSTKNNYGYGVIRHLGFLVYAHRLAWELTNGPIPDGLYACHKCDNPICINPDHLFLGTADDNSRDRDVKGRCSAAKLNGNEVIAARQLYARGLATVSDLSRCFHVTYGNMHAIVTGRTWKHLPVVRQAAQDARRLD